MKNSKIKIAAGLLITILLFTLPGALILSYSLPDNILISENEKNGQWLPEGFRWICRSEEEPGGEVWQNSAEKLNTDTGETYSATVYFCGVIPVKSVELAVSDDLTVVPGGDAIGINLHPDGILVAGTAEIDSPNGRVSPAKDAGIEPGDIIQKINGTPVSDTSEVTAYVEKTTEPLVFEGKRGKKDIRWTVMPSPNANGRNKIGLWIRDTVSGIGTLSFYTDSGFAALGHPISDIDTGLFVEAAGGSIYSASIVGVDKGQKGVPGSLCGIFTSNKLGEIGKNTDCGVFGSASAPNRQKVSVARKSEVKCAEAQLLCNIGNGVETFEIEIVKLMPSSNSTKGMVIHITDSRLLEQTGGIVQGMSGSPVLQNGKIVGAVTHV